MDDRQWTPNIDIKPWNPLNEKSAQLPSLFLFIFYISFHVGKNKEQNLNTYHLWAAFTQLWPVDLHGWLWCLCHVYFLQ